MAVRKTKKEHCDRLRDIHKSMATKVARVNKEIHIPIWQLRVWIADLKSTASFMRKEMRQELELRLEKSSRKLRKK